MPYPAVRSSKPLPDYYDYTHHDFFLLRTPSLPIDYLKCLHSLRNAGTSDDNLFTSPLFLEALFLGSYELYQQYRKYLQGARYSERITAKLFYGIERYFIRMCSRSTPYGLFAGYKAGRIGPATSVHLGSKDSYRKHLHLDIHYFAELCRHLQTFPEIRSNILFFTNNSLYRTGEKIRYVESFTNDLTRSYRISAIDSSPYIDAVLSAADGGARLDDLLAGIDSEEVGEEEAKGFLEALIDNQLLVGDLEPAPSGGDILGNLIAKLSFLPPDHLVRTTLSEAAFLLNGPDPGIGGYENISTVLGKIFPDTPSQHLTYTDLEFTAGEAVIGEAVIRNIQSHVANLRPLFLLRGNEHLRAWKKAFLEKYEGEEVPLTIALDPELGIGYRDYNDTTLTYTPLLEGLSIDNKPAAKEIVWSRLLKWKNKKLKEALFKGEEFVITDEDIADIGFDDLRSESPDNVYIMGSILADSSHELDEGHYIFSLDTCFGPGSVNLISRFSNDNGFLKEKLKECVESEEEGHPDKVYAELVYLPESRAANLMLRPRLRKYEIPYLAKSTALPEHQIPVSDLMVSCSADKVILRSRRLNKEVVPRSTTSHNFMTTDLPVYKFLCDLQMQQVNSAIVWDWDIFIDDSYLPRVMYKNILLSPAIWNIDYDELTVLHGSGRANIGKEHLLSTYGKVRSQLGLPARVVIMNSDQKLFIDLEEEAYVRLFHDYFQKNRRLRLQEFLFLPENCFVTGEQGKFAHEIIIPHSRRKPAPPDKNLPSRHTHANKTVRREFAVGSEWLFLKLYTANATAERILKENIGIMARQLLTSGLITKWFFIRYADPKPHLRLRFFHPTDKTFWNRVVDRINVLLEDLSANGVMVKAQYDTYERELGRYGYDKIEFSESLFHHDSEAVVTILGSLEGEDSEERRWLIALRDSDMLLSDFHMDLESKHKLLDFLKDDFCREFKVDKTGLVQFDQLYRTNAKKIAGIIDRHNDDTNGMASMVAALEERSNRNAPIIGEFLLPGLERTDLPGLIASHLHMALNRLLITDHRKQELVIYYLLARYYQSRLGYLKYNGSFAGQKTGYGD